MRWNHGVPGVSAVSKQLWFRSKQTKACLGSWPTLRRICPLNRFLYEFCSIKYSQFWYSVPGVWRLIYARTPPLFISTWRTRTMSGPFWCFSVSQLSMYMLNTMMMSCYLNAKEPALWRITKKTGNFTVFWKNILPASYLLEVRSSLCSVSFLNCFWRD